jgi:hypothetical protein
MVKSGEGRTLDCIQHYNHHLLTVASRSAVAAVAAEVAAVRSRLVRHLVRLAVAVQRSIDSIVHNFDIRHRLRTDLVHRSTEYIGHCNPRRNFQRQEAEGSEQVQSRMSHSHNHYIRCRSHLHTLDDRHILHNLYDADYPCGADTAP